MEWMGLNDIRESFLRFYESKGHLRLPSAPLVPKGDSGLLLINSGMAPLKPYFIGAVTPPRKRVTTCQKCIRTPDIERVGKTARHGTFFEMMGNFSFGDYFKKEAITWAWEFSTQVMKLPPDRIHASIYEDDDEAYDLWHDMIGLDDSHIKRLGREDNFWEIGAGPCGPCSELYFDRGEKYGCGRPDCGVGCECDRYIEYWNLVFTQFDHDGNGNYSRLAHPNIDTGMGLERMACIMQDVDNLFEVDTIRNIALAAAARAGVEYGKDARTDVALRVITDHIRSTVFMISDGVLPSNEGRGYVLRRLLRRAARYGRLLGIEEPFLFELCDVVIRESGNAYPELVQKREYIKKILETEEKRFAQTLQLGLSLLEDMLASHPETLSGDDIFKLYDTFGFPFELTEEIAAERGVAVDEKGFRAYMQQQREKARSGRKDTSAAAWTGEDVPGVEKGRATEFAGYEELTAPAKILAVLVNGEPADGAQTGDEAALVLDRTSFYAESGGQMGDIGTIVSSDKTADGQPAALFRVSGVTKTNSGLFVHRGVLEDGVLLSGAQVETHVDADNRAATARNHSAAHLLQASLRRVLGEHVEQAGQLVNAKHVRFDFTHFSAVTKEELAQVESLVNHEILAGLAVSVTEMKLEEARASGAMALFGEKYGEYVRVVRMGDFSAELCGGTHVKNTAQIGLFKIVSESSVASGVRRIEGVTGFNLLSLVDTRAALLSDIAAVLKTNPDAALQRAEQLMAETRELKNKVDELQQKLSGGLADELAAKMKKAVSPAGAAIRLLTEELPSDMETAQLRKLGDDLKAKYADLTAVLAVRSADKVNFLAVCGKDAVAAGVKAGDLVKTAAAVCGGGGGGRPDSAMAGGKLPDKLPEALQAVRKALQAE